jgi:hypothetical protein
MDIILETLESAIKSNRIVSLCYKKINWENRIVCLISHVDINTGMVKIQKITPTCKKGKVMEIEISLIFCLELDDKYNYSLQYLIHNDFIEWKKNKKQRSFQINKENTNESLYSLFKFNQLCTFYFDTEYVTGYIDEIYTSAFKVRNINYYGELDGFSIYKSNLLTKVTIGNFRETKIQFLHEVVSNQNN